MSTLLTREYAAVGCQGEVVFFRLGNLVFSMEFPVALYLSAVMRHQAQLAKLHSGIITRGYYCVGVLSDLSAPKPKRKRFMEKLPQLLKAKGISVDTEGRMVILKIDRMTAKFSYQTARMISQWLRVRGKEAKGKAGEKAHWSELSNEGPSPVGNAA